MFLTLFTKQKEMPFSYVVAAKVHKKFNIIKVKTCCPYVGMPIQQIQLQTFTL